jgi:NAD-dependent dihydropyrimidine dehydrogenase PreA subunit
MIMKMQYLKNVATLKLNPDLCVGCGRCLEVCPHGVFQLDNRKATIVSRDACMECGACARNCPVQAIFVKNGVGCAVGLLNAKLGRPSACCGGDQSSCCSS